MIGASFDRVERALEERSCIPRGNIERGLMALCPAHADVNPSLHVDHRDDRTLLYCHAGCDTEQVLDALALSWDALFDEPRERVP